MTSTYYFPIILTPLPLGQNYGITENTSIKHGKLQREILAWSFNLDI
jgi:hypothetical protein